MTHKRIFRSRLLPMVTAFSVMASACVVDRNKVETPDAPPPVAKEEPKAPERVYPDPPPPTEPRPHNFPALQKHKLDNGLELFVVENHEVPLVDIQVVFKTGEVFDELLAGMTADILLEGTAGRKGLSKAEIDERIEQVGASLNASAGRFTTTLSTRVLKPDLEMALDLIAEVASNPKMDKEALDKLKEEAVVNLRNEKSSGQSLGQRLLGQVLYPEGHPYGPAFPTKERIDGITVEALQDFHKAWYVPNNAFVIVSGDVTMDEAKAIVEKEMGKLKPATSFPEHPLSKFKPEDYQKAKPTKMQVHVVDRTSISTEIFVANLSLARNHPDWVKWDVTNRILGAGVSSRLFQDIRETRDLTYGIGSTVIPSKAVGAFVIGTQTKKIDEMMIAIFEHLDRIRTEDPTDKEYEQARKAIAQSFPLRTETAGQVAGMVRQQLVYGLPDDYFATYRDAVLEVNKDDVKATAAKHIDGTPVIVMVGRKRKIMSALGRVPELKDAEVLLYNTDLERIDEDGKPLAAAK